MNRKDTITRIEEVPEWDFLIIGGGATGLGTAVDAASRGFKTLLLEQVDFAKGTSSRSTKLVHGGVRYLEQGNVKLVLEALRERGLFLKNAPHLSKKLAFIIPVYSLWEEIKYFAGLKLYDWMAGKERIGASKWVSKSKVIERMPGVAKKGLRGGVLYYDGQFDDARMALALARTCEDHGGSVINYFTVKQILKDKNGKVCGVTAQDNETGKSFKIRSKVVINATGVFVDEIHEMDSGHPEHTVQPSQGIHLVLPPAFLGTLKYSLMIPKTDDGRVLFLVPWHNHLLMGTTDTPVKGHDLEPKPLENEIEFILRNAGKYLNKAPQRSDVLSVFAGLRPLAIPANSDGKKTKDISRHHHVESSPTGLLSITGGKWTTYRQMAEDIVDFAIKQNSLPAKICKTTKLPIHGFEENEKDEFEIFGSDLPKIKELIELHEGWEKKLDSEWPYTIGQVIWSVKEEMARKVEDILCRRFRIVFLDVKAALRMAPLVAEIMASQLGKDDQWIAQELDSFRELARGYELERKDIKTQKVIS